MQCYLCALAGRKSIALRIIEKGGKKLGVCREHGEPFVTLAAMPGARPLIALSAIEPSEPKKKEEKMRRPKVVIDLEAFKRDYESGLSVAELQSMFGIKCRTMFYYYARKAGCVFRSGRGKASRVAPAGKKPGRKPLRVPDSERPHFNGLAESISVSVNAELLDRLWSKLDLHEKAALLFPPA